LNTWTICNCYDAARLTEWARLRGYRIAALFGADNKIFIRGLVFCWTEELARLRTHVPSKFSLAPMPEITGEEATCSDTALIELMRRVHALTGAKAPKEVRKLPKVGDIVMVYLPPVFEGVPGEVERVSPSTGNVRVLMAGKFWTVPWHLLAPKITPENH